MTAKIELRKTSFIDFPGLISSVFFFPGCNLRCPWCHNREFVTGGNEGKNLISLQDGLAFLRKRINVLGGVVLSGGEPCLYNELSFLIAEIKKLKPFRQENPLCCEKQLLVKLDTNGMLPAVLQKLFCREETRPDYIALDLKLSPSRYAELLPVNSSLADAALPPAEALIKSAALVRQSGIPHEFRSLALPGGFFTDDDIKALIPLVKDSPWYFRPFRGGNCLDPAWDNLEESAGEERARVLTARARELGKNQG